MPVSHYLCRDCGAVSADPADPPVCGRCGGRRLRELAGGPQAGAYFAPDREPNSDGSPDALE